MAEAADRPPALARLASGHNCQRRAPGASRTIASCAGSTSEARRTWSTPQIRPHITVSAHMPARATRGKGSRKISRATTPMLAATTMKLPKTVADTAQPPQRTANTPLLRRAAAVCASQGRNTPAHLLVPTSADIPSTQMANGLLTTSGRCAVIKVAATTMPPAGPAVGAAAHAPVLSTPVARRPCPPRQSAGPGPREPPGMAQRQRAPQISPAGGRRRAD